MHAARHQAGDVGHVHHQVGAVAVGDLGQAGKVDGAGVSRRAGHQHLGPGLFDGLFHLVVVDAAVLAHAIGDEVVVLARHIHRRAVGQVAALGQVHPHDGVAQVQQGEVDRQVGLRARVGLHVGVLCAEQLAGPADGDVLHLVHIGAAAVIALARQALGVLVGQHAAHGGHHGRGDDVLTGDQLDVLALAGQLPAHGGAHFRVHAVHHADGVHHFLVHFHTPLFIKSEVPPPCAAFLLTLS